MNLDDAQKNKVAGWVSEGLKLSEIQSRLAAELGVIGTYMEVRLLVDDLRLTPKDSEPPKTAHINPSSTAAPLSTTPPPSLSASPSPTASPKSETPPTTNQVSVKVDQIARPGAAVSGSVTFTDGNSAEWYLDPMGRLGLVPKQQGYRPSQQDVMTFQTELQNELAKIGF